MLQAYSLFRSELKLKIISSLKQGELDLSGMREILGSSGSTILHAINDLSSLGLIEKSGKSYQLSPLGQMYSVVLTNLSNNLGALDSFHDFWLQHDVKGIPESLINQIGVMKNAVLVKNDSIELDKVHSTFRDLLLSARKVYGVSPIFHPDYITTFQKLLDEGATIDLVATPEVLKRTITSTDTTKILEFITEGKLKIRLNEKIRVALTVTDKSFSMGLFTNQGEYDYSTDLVSDNAEIIQWGEALFKHIASNSKSFELNDLI